MELGFSFSMKFGVSFPFNAYPRKKNKLWLNYLLILSGVRFGIVLFFCGDKSVDGSRQLSDWEGEHVYFWGFV